MSLFTPQQTVQLIKNGHDPEADHAPVVLLQTKHEGDVLMSFMLTHVEPDYPDQAYGLVDFGHGKPRLSMVFLPQLESHDERYNIEVEPVTNFDPQYPCSVYAKAAQMMGKVTLNPSALRMATNHLEISRQRDPFKTALKDGPAFLPLPPSLN